MWTFVQATGWLLSPIGGVFAIGYSGSPGYLNKPEFENVAFQGPIPRAVYTVGPPENSPTHGPYALRLTPEDGSELFGRSGFLIHGDSIAHPGSASAGCIVLSRFARERIWMSGDHRIEVVAQPGDVVKTT